MLHLRGTLTDCLLLPPIGASNPTSRTAVPATDSLLFAPSCTAYNHQHNKRIRSSDHKTWKSGNDGKKFSHDTWLHTKPSEEKWSQRKKRQRGKKKDKDDGRVEITQSDRWQLWIQQHLKLLRIIIGHVSHAESIFSLRTAATKVQIFRLFGQEDCLIWDGTCGFSDWLWILSLIYEILKNDATSS